jgi:hypothetical protein
MKTPAILRAFAAVLAIAASGAPALAGQLAVGEVIPLEPPPGYAFRPLYTPPIMQSRWEPADTTFGVTFREPVYSTPRGYVYRYVRGYTRVRVADSSLRPVRVVRKPAARKRGSGCITDLGYGHWYYCGR